MSSLRSALDEMAAADNRDLSPHELNADVSELLEAQRLIEVQLAEKVKAQSDRGDHAEMGYPSATAYLMHQGGMSAGRARRIVADGNAAEKAPESYRAWADGRLSTDQARRLFALSEATPDQFGNAEEMLVEIIEPLSVSETARALEYWRQAVDGPGELTDREALARRGVSMSETIGGIGRVDAWMTPTAFQAFKAALEANMTPPSADDTRTPRQRRHDALEDLARSYLDSDDTPQVGGEKPHIMVLADLEALQGVAGGTHETLDGTVLDVATIRRLACDASISRIVLGPDSEILDIGRKTRVWTAAQRRAIIARDRHCQAQGCERPPQWCDIHHIDHWADGGVTSVDKGELLCRFHHTLEHLEEAKRRRRRR